MLCLGTMFQLDGGSHATLAYRTSQAWRKFWAHKELLMCKFVEPLVRVRLLEIVVKPCILWGLECGYLTEDNIEALKRTQISMCCIILNHRRQPGESRVEMFRRRRRLAGNFLRANGIFFWSDCCRHKLVSWAGHVWRHSVYRPGSFALLVLQWRDVQWWRQRQQTLPRGHSHENRHPVRFRARRFEDRVVKFFQDCRAKFPESCVGCSCWQDLASCKQSWAFLNSQLHFGG